MRSGALDLDLVHTSRASSEECEPTYCMGIEPDHGLEDGIRPKSLVKRVLSPIEARNSFRSRTGAREGISILDTPRETPQQSSSCDKAADRRGYADMIVMPSQAKASIGRVEAIPSSERIRMSHAKGTTPSHDGRKQYSLRSSMSPVRLLIGSGGDHWNQVPLSPMDGRVGAWNRTTLSLSPVGSPPSDQPDSDGISPSLWSN